MEISNAVTMLSALGHEHRLAIYRYLVQAGPQGAPAGDIGETFGIPGATLSFHLNALKQSGLIAVRREGRSLIYAPCFDEMNGLLSYLFDNCCGGHCAAPIKKSRKRRKS